MHLFLRPRYNKGCFVKHIAHVTPSSPVSLRLAAFSKSAVTPHQIGPTDVPTSMVLLAQPCQSELGSCKAYIAGM